MKLRIAVIVAVAAACGDLLLAQQEPLPTFRTGVEAVQVDAVVTDADGNLVTDLTADDFEIVENGVPRPLTAFSLVDIPLDPPLGPAESWPVQPDVRTNDGPEGRVYLIAFNTSINPDIALRTRLFVRWFLEENFRPNDLGAVVLMGRGLVTDGQDFTSDPKLLLAAAEKFMGGEDTEVNPLGPRDRLESLRYLAEMLAAMPGGRKALLVFGGVPGLDAERLDELRPSTVGLRFGSEDSLDAISAATRGSVLIYPIDPAGLTTGFGGFDERMDAASLANVTGGFALYNSNNFRAAFDRIVRDHSTYYVLGFNSAYTARDGRFVPVDVRVKRPGLRVQARAGYVAPARRPRARPEAASAAIGALEHPVTTSGVPIRLFAAPYKGRSGPEAAVAIVAEVDVAGLDFVERSGAAGADLEVTYLATDMRKRAYPGGRHTINLTVPADGLVVPGAVRVVSQIALPPGRFQLRAAAGSGTQSGSVVYDLEVPDFGRDLLMMSGVSITSTDASIVQTFRPPPASEAGRKSLRCNPPSCVVPLLDGAPSDQNPLDGALPDAPTAAREFYQEETITLYAEVYDNRPARRDDPAHAITLTTTLRGEDGTVYPMTSETRPSTAERRPSGGHGFMAEFPLDEVPLGRYVLTVEARSDAGDGATASRALPIVVQ